MQKSLKRVTYEERLEAVLNKINKDIKNNKLEGEITAYEIDPSTVETFGVWRT